MSQPDSHPETRLRKNRSRILYLACLVASLGLVTLGILKALSGNADAVAFAAFYGLTSLFWIFRIIRNSSARGPE